MGTDALSPKEQAAVREFAFRLRDRFPREVDQIRLYGSKARGESQPESDVDLLLLVQRRTPVVDEAIIALVCDILNEYGVFLETVTLTSDDYRQALDRQYPFALNVERDTVAL